MGTSAEACGLILAKAKKGKPLSQEELALYYDHLGDVEATFQFERKLVRKALQGVDDEHLLAAMETLEHFPVSKVGMAQETSHVTPTYHHGKFTSSKASDTISVS